MRASSAAERAAEDAGETEMNRALARSIRSGRASKRPAAEYKGKSRSAPAPAHGEDCDHCGSPFCRYAEIGGGR